jgi:hypothetical protein
MRETAGITKCIEIPNSTKGFIVYNTEEKVMYVEFQA